MDEVSLKSPPACSASMVKFNVGGKIYCSSKQTLLSIPDTFFTGLLSGRIETLKDDSNAIFIDRDPKLFSTILNFLRTRQLHVDYRKLDVDLLRHEAEYYGVLPLVKKLDAYSKLSDDTYLIDECGSMPFHAILKVPTSNCDGNQPKDSMGPVVQIVAKNESVLIAHRHHIACYKLKTIAATKRYFQSDYISPEIGSVAYLLRYSTSEQLIAIHHHLERRIVLWTIDSEDKSPEYKNVHTEIGRFDLNGCNIDALFFLENHLNFLIALGFDKGRVGVWHPTSRNWLIQNLSSQFQNAPTITAYHKAGRFLVFGSERGAIYFIDMQKFPLRLNNGDLLINKLFQDPDYEEITAISCYLTPISEYYIHENLSAVNKIEIAYGTSMGRVRILLKQPETIGFGPELFQTFEVHFSPIVRISLNESYVISVCKNMHVRTWKLTRFRGHISTYPGTTSHANFRLTYLNGIKESTMEQTDQSLERNHLIDRHYNIEPFFDFDRNKADGSIMIEKLHDDSCEISILSAADGSRLGRIVSVDRSPIVCVSVEECVLGVKSRLTLFTGHENGHCQVWDLGIVINQPMKTIDSNGNSTHHHNDRWLRQKEILKAIFRLDSDPII